MSNEVVEQEQSPKDLDSDPGSEEMKGDETQQTLGQTDDDPPLKKSIPRPEDYDFFLNVRHREQKEPVENDEPTEY